MSRPAIARKPRASSQARIQQILEAARSQLAEEGVASLSIYSVAERAGIHPLRCTTSFPACRPYCRASLPPCTRPSVIAWRNP